MTKEEAIEKVREMKLSPGKDAELIIALHTLIPELRESEDERTRKDIINLIYWLKGNPSLCSQYYNDRYDSMLAYLEKQKEQKPIEMEVYEIGKGTTICGQDYKCKKDYKVGNCWYIKDVIYHCNRDGYLNDQNGVSWSCTPKWFNEYIYTNSELADEEKNDFVSGQFLQCKLSFDGFKEGEHYWLEYIGDDMYVGRSDNILNQKFHITPRQLYTLFSEQLEENEKEQNLNFDTHWENGSLVYEQKEQKPVDLHDKIEELCSEYPINKYSVSDEELSAYHQGVHLGATKIAEYLSEQKPAEWSEEDEGMLNCIIATLCEESHGGRETNNKMVTWLENRLKSLRPVSKESLQPHWKPCEEQIHAIIEALKYLPNNKGEWMILNTLVDVFKKLM